MSLNIPERSHVLLDTSVLIDASKNITEYEVLFNRLTQSRATFTIDKIIELEFLRGFSTQEIGKRVLSDMSGDDEPVVLSLDDVVFEKALEIVQIYKKADNKDGKIPDVLIAAQIAKYAKDVNGKQHGVLVLATQNHRDFPPVLFDRIDDMLITLKDGSIKVIGFYVFSLDKYDKTLKALKIKN